ncbi:GNAT family N-acetyltransferase [Mesorhizobium sp. INR15]|uniref:GNAT family N-acetyltransferase n=1 Tax=Mesorhizobium sp. INR15 TaxID=2654248 RepID=UPI00189686E1|nr:GNAT family N-acetyltransferase [Mesorhizobium sp. INR15]QPC90743.1 GNAT family N-acetyltransferase [Mesorhizobium sp. INR15]
MQNRKLTIRLARPEEREALEELQWRASLANENDRDALLEHPDAIELPLAQIEAGQVLVAEIDGSTVGFAAILPRDDGDIDLDGLFVEPDLWRAGAGRALVDHCSQLGRQLGATGLHVVGNPHAIGFYQACGFEVTGSHVTLFGSGILMRRKL